MIIYCILIFIHIDGDNDIINRDFCDLFVYLLMMLMVILVLIILFMMQKMMLLRLTRERDDVHLAYIRLFIFIESLIYFYIVVGSNSGPSYLIMVVVHGRKA